MKSYNVKSNAKRFARGIAAKYPGFQVDEPVLVNPGMDSADGREWFPAVIQTDIIGILPDEVTKTCVVLERIGGPVATVDEQAPEPEQDASGLKSMFDAVEPAGDLDLMAVAATLPPPVRSSREEIDARRAERRARVEQEKAEGIRDRTGARIESEKISKKKIILDLIRRPNGATQRELEEATGWQRHTLRGYIAGTLRKTLAAIGARIDCQRGKGENPTRYILVGPAKGGDA